VSVFLNGNTTPGELLFATPTNYTPTGTAGAFTAIIAGQFDNDTNPDLLIANSGADASNNYNVTVLKGTGAGMFNTVAAIIVGTTAPSGVTIPSSLAVGSFNNDNF